MTRAQRRPCRYEAYIPDRLAELDVVLPADVAADVSDAERAILRLNAEGPPGSSLEGVARLLLRAEAVGLVDALTGFERGLACPEGDTRVSPPVRPVPYRRARISTT